MKTTFDKPFAATTVLTAIIYAFIAFWIFRLLTASVHAGVITNASGQIVGITNPPATVMLEWNPPTNTFGVAGYNLYQGVASGVYTNSADAGNFTNFTMIIPRGVKCFFAATAYGVTGLESPFSNEATYTATNVIPGSPSMKAPVTLIVQHSPSGPAGKFSDTEMAWSLDPSTGTNDFFRLRIVALNPQPQPQALPLVVPRATTPPPIPGQ